MIQHVYPVIINLIFLKQAYSILLYNTMKNKLQLLL